MQAFDDVYDEVPYDDRPVAETHPDRLYLAARRAGLEVAEPARARILELGCAHAVNLLPIAAAHPEARVLGIDRAERQIARARADVKDAGLDNLEVRVGDVTTLDLGDEQFDYVIAHGLLSWVPDVVRDRLLALCRRVVAPRGVVYLSYNTMPTWGVRGGVRRALLEIVGDATEPAEQLRRARAGLEWLADACPFPRTAEGALLRQEVESLRERPDTYLLHEYLVPFSRAYWLRELLELTDAAGLRYLADVAPSGLGPAEERETRARIGAHTSAADARVAPGDPLAIEQLFDVVTFRQMRATLFRRDDDTVSRAPSSRALLEPLHLSMEPPAGTLATAPATEDPHHRAALATLRARWPGDTTLGALLRELEGVDADALAAWLLDAVDAGLVDARPRALHLATTVSERPCASAVTRSEARRLPFVTTARHGCATIDPLHAAVLRLLDGTRTRAQIVDALCAEVDAGRLGFGDATRDTAVSALPRLLDRALEAFCAAGLLVS